MVSIINDELFLLKTIQQQEQKKWKRATLMFRCFLPGFLAPEREIFIVVADGTCWRRRKKSLCLKINYSPAQHARTKKLNKTQKDYYYTCCWEWKKERVKLSSWVKTNLMSSPLRKRMRSPGFSPHSSAGLSERETRSVAGSHTSVRNERKQREKTEFGSALAAKEVKKTSRQRWRGEVVTHGHTVVCLQSPSAEVMNAVA